MHESPLECAHEICNCSVTGPVDGSEVYCGNFCRNADEQGIESETCACGHPECDTP
ncbi:MAG TPA: hypothetical protein VFE16_02335 [Candidatus Cybelea sp.]|jgi:hypothetical protein|nr:hypothetical protein [Candidatus Cybelea sp.]